MSNLDICEPYNFNIITVGASGTGKTTCLRSLFISMSKRLRKFKKLQRTTKIEEVGKFTIKNCTFTLYDSVGYGDLENNTNAVQTIKGEIIKRHHHWLSVNGQSMLTDELKSHDSRIHCVFYFLNSRINEIDIKFMKELSDYVPIVPIVSMADKLVTKERYQFFREIHQALRDSKAPIYDFHEDESGDFIDFDNISDVRHSLYCSDDENERTSNVEQDEMETKFSEETNTLFHNVGEALLNQDITVESKVIDKQSERLPTPRMKNVFALMCSITGRREYPWCTLYIDNEEYSDFIRLQRLIFDKGEHLKGLRRKTEEMTRLLHLKESSKCESFWQLIKANTDATGAFIYSVIVVLVVLFAFRLAARAFEFAANNVG